MIHQYLSKKENVIKGKKKKITPNSNKVLNLLFKGKCHYGQSVQKTNPINYPNLYGIRSNQSILDLSITTQNLLRAFSFLRNLLNKNPFTTYRGSSKIVLVCNSSQIEHLSIFDKHKEFGSYIHIVNSFWESQYFATVFKLKKKKKTKILAVVILSTDNFEDIVKEAKKYNLPIISLVDTDQNPFVIDYPVMSNTVNLTSLYTVIALFKKLLNIKK